MDIKICTSCPHLTYNYFEGRHYCRYDGLYALDDVRTCPLPISQRPHFEKPAVTLENFMGVGL